MAKAGKLKLDFMAKKAVIAIHFFGLNTFLDVIEILKLQKPCWPYGHLKEIPDFANLAAQKFLENILVNLLLPKSDL